MSNNDENNWDYEPTPEEEIQAGQDLQARMQVIAEEHSNFVVALASYGLLQSVVDNVSKSGDIKSVTFCHIVKQALQMLLVRLDEK